MLPDAGLFAGRTNLVSGPGPGSGKTSFAKAALASLRLAGERCALISAGVEGAAPRHGQGRDQVALEPGEVFLVPAAFLRSATCEPEILDAVPGSSALGRLAIARARRRGLATLVGPERNEYLAWAIGRIREENWASTVIVDGALNRLTQAATLGGVRLFFAARAGRADFQRVASRMRHMHDLVRLPEYAKAPKVPGATVLRHAGPFTSADASRLHPDVRTVVVGDFTKVFLEGRELRSLLKSVALYVEKAVEFGGFSIALRDIRRATFAEALGESAAAVVSWDAYAQDACEQEAYAL
jgi:hypothetical protein